MVAFPDNQIPASGNPGIDGGVRMGGAVSPSDWSDMQYGFYTHRSNLGKGGLHSGFDITARDALTKEIREFGMVYICTSGPEAGKLYKLCNTSMGGVDDDKTNNANWIEFAGTPKPLGGRINYGMLFMSRMGNVSQTTLDNNFNNGDHQYLYLGVKNGDYDNCLVDFVGYNTSFVEVERSNGIRLTSENDMYSFMQANFANNGTNYTNTIKAYIYDEIDSELPVINKINGINAFFGSLVGKKNYKRGAHTHLDVNDNRYSNFQSWIQEAIRLLTPHTSYTYNSSDEPRRVVRRPSNHRTLYGLINASGMIDNNWGERYSINTNLNFVNVQGRYSVKHNNSYYCILDLNSLNFQFLAKSDFKEVIKYIGDPNYSVIICYQLKKGDNYSIYIKPVGVDTMYLDYVDTSKYSLEVLHHARNQFTRLNQSQISLNSLLHNAAIVEKKYWIYQGRGGQSKGGYREKPYTNFILRDKTTLKISQKSKATVKWRSGRDAPLYATVNY